MINELRMLLISGATLDERGQEQKGEKDKCYYCVTVNCDVTGPLLSSLHSAPLRSPPLCSCSARSQCKAKQNGVGVGDRKQGCQSKQSKKRAGECPKKRQSVNKTISKKAKGPKFFQVLLHFTKQEKPKL